MIKGNRDKVLYLNKGLSRRSQIYNWVKEVMSFNNLSFNDVFLQLNSKEFKKAFNEFKKIIFIVINSEETLGYIIRENMSHFGERTTLNDLYRNLVTNRFKKKIPVPKRSQAVTKKTLNQFQKTEIASKNIRFGIDSKGKRSKGELRAIVIKEKLSYRVVDLETGKFLKPSQSAQKEIKKLKEL